MEEVRRITIILEEVPCTKCRTPVLEQRGEWESLGGMWGYDWKWGMSCLLGCKELLPNCISDCLIQHSLFAEFPFWFFTNWPICFTLCVFNFPLQNICTSGSFGKLILVFQYSCYQSLFYTKSFLQVFLFPSSSLWLIDIISTVWLTAVL